MKTIKQVIKETLGDNYKTADDFMIEEIVYKYELLKQAKKSIKETGLLYNIRNSKKDEPAYYNRNPAYTIYMELDKGIKDSYVKLGITPQERKKIKETIKEISDGFDEDFI